MTIDKGGLQYGIDVNGNFADLLKFRQEVQGATEDWDRFAAQISKSRSETTAVSAEVAKMAAAAESAAKASSSLATTQERLATASKATAAAVSAEGEGQDVATLALKKREAALLKLLVAQEEANLAMQDGFAIETEQRTSNQQLQEANKKLTAILDKRGETEARLAAIAERGSDLSLEEAKALKLLTTEEILLLNAKTKLEQAKASFGKDSITRVQAETEAIRRQTAAEKESLTQRILFSKGLNAQGNGPLELPNTAATGAGPLLTEEEKLLQTAQDRLAVLQAQTTSDRLRQIDAEIEATKRQLAAEKEVATQRLLFSRGLNARGDGPLELPNTAAKGAGPLLSDQEKTLQKANQIVDRAQQEEALRLELAKRGLDISGRPLPVASPPDPGNASLKDQIKSLLGLSGAASQAESAASKAAFTFRRLFGIFAAFQIIRAGVSGFFGLVKDTITFNAQIEQANLGIASLLTAVGDVTDATGAAVDKTRQLALAQGEARRQIELLRRDALQTTATFEQLVATFQTALAPGFRAGLNVDQIRKFAISISQAAAAIGLSENQLAEEIRSILQGTIQARTTRIAVALGITNEDIRNAKQLGTLSEFLNKKFEAFAVAGKESLNTFDNLIARVRSGLALILQSGGLTFFSRMKDLLRDVFSLLTRTDPITGLLTPSPEAVLIVQTLAQGLTDAVSAAINLQTSLDFNQVLGVATAVASVISSISLVAASVIRGLVQGISDISGGVTLISNIIKSLRLDAILEPAVRILTVLVGLKISLSLAVLSAGLLGGALSSIFTVLKAIRAVVAATLALNAGAVPLALAQAGAFEQVRRSILNSVAAAGASGLLGTIGLCTAAVVGAGGLYYGWKKVLDTVTGTNTGLLDQIKIFGFLIQNSANLAVAASDSNHKYSAMSALLFGIAGLTQEIGDQTKKIDKTGPEGLSKAFSEIPGQIQRSRDVLASLGDVLKKIREDSVATQEELKFTLQNLGLEGPILDQQRTTFEAMVRLRQDSKTLVEEQRQIEAEMLGVGRQLLTNKEAINRLAASEQDLVSRGVALAQSQVAATEKVAVAQNQVLAAQEAFNKAKQASQSPAQVSSAQKELDLAKARLASREQELQKIKDQADLLLKSLNGQQDAEKRVTDLIVEKVRLLGQEVATAETLKALAQGRLDLELRISQATTQRLLGQSEQANFALQEEQQLQAVRTYSQLLTLWTSLANEEVRAVAAKENEISLSEAQILIDQSRRAIQEQRLQGLLEESRLREGQIATALAGTTDDTRRSELQNQILDQQRLSVSLEQQIALAKENSRLKAEEEAAALALSNQELEQLKARLDDSSFGAKLSESLRQLNEELPSRFKVTLDTLRNGVNGFASFAASAITDAFDPSKSVNLKERFGQFLLGFAQQIIQTLIQIAVVKSLLGLGFLGGFAAGGSVPAVDPTAGVPSGALGLARGGQVPRIGLAGGGSVPNVPVRVGRPSGLPSSDTTPIWGTPGEFMQPVPTVQALGVDFMEVLRTMRFDPLALRAAAGLQGRPSSPSGMPRGTRTGYASGGSIQAPVSSVGGLQSQSSGIGLSVMVASDDALEKLLRAGKGAMIRELEAAGFERTRG